MSEAALMAIAFCGWPGAPAAPFVPLVPAAPFVPFVPLPPFLPAGPVVFHFRVFSVFFLHLTLDPTMRIVPPFFFWQA